MFETGMTPMDCIKAVNAADLCGTADQAGTIENGKTADIIAVVGDPLEDVAALQQIGFAMLRGKVLSD